jgi:hypothetical protein
MEEFNSHMIGVSVIHPEYDPYYWPPPLGQNSSKPKENVLRQSFLDYKDDEKQLYDFYTREINRYMLHKCKFGSCLDKASFKMVPIIENGKPKLDKNKKPVKEKVYPCRFKYPFVTFGCEKEIDEENKELKRIYARLDKDGNLEVDGSIHNGDELVLLRNHPDLNNHIPEILVIWNATVIRKQSPLMIK